MKTCFYILIFLGLSFFSEIHAQQVSPVTSGKGYRVPVCVYEGDTIPCITLRNIYVYPKLKFKNKRQERYYYKLVRDVKRRFLGQRNQTGRHRDIRIYGNAPQPKSQGTTHEDGRKRIEGTIHRPHEKLTFHKVSCLSNW